MKVGGECLLLWDTNDAKTKPSFNAFNEGTRLVHCVKLAEKLFGEKITKLGGDCSYSGNDNRNFCSEENIVTSFSQKGRKRALDSMQDGTANLNTLLLTIHILQESQELIGSLRHMLRGMNRFAATDA